MRIFLDKNTSEIIGINKERVTSILPPSYIGNNSIYIDFDIDDRFLNDENNAAIKKLYKKRNALLGKKLYVKGKNFLIKKIKRETWPTVMIDIDNPDFHKDITLYTQKAIDMGVKVEISDIMDRIDVKILANQEIVGKMLFIRKNCCTYLYQDGKVYNRKYYPHYIGMLSVYNYLKKKGFKKIDLGGLLKKDGGLNRFKKKWGKVTKIEV